MKFFIHIFVLVLSKQLLEMKKNESEVLAKVNILQTFFHFSKYKMIQCDAISSFKINIVKKIDEMICTSF